MHQAAAAQAAITHAASTTAVAKAAAQPPLLKQLLLKLQRLLKLVPQLARHKTVLQRSKPELNNSCKETTVMPCALHDACKNTSRCEQHHDFHLVP
jgi:hypothetical protein